MSSTPSGPESGSAHGRGLLDALERASEDPALLAALPAPDADASALCRADIEHFCGLLDRLEARFSVAATCAEGCGHCCRQLIALTQSELEPLGRFLQSLDEAQRQRVRTRCVVLCNTLAEYGIETGGVIADRHTYDLLLALYDRLFLFCPLLDANKRCMVYPVRPGVCWSYRSYGDPSLCAQPRGSDHCVCFSALAEAATDRLAAALGQSRGKLLLLPFAVKDLLAEQALEGRESWHAAEKPNTL